MRFLLYWGLPLPLLVVAGLRFAGFDVLGCLLLVGAWIAGVCAVAFDGRREGL